MFVDHLADGIAQQHDELVEAFDGALQFDAIDQVYGHGYAFAAQCIQEWVLQRLAFGHDGLRYFIIPHQPARSAAKGSRPPIQQ